MKYVGLILALLFATPQDKKRCDLKTTEEASWCEGCNKLLEKADMMGNGDCRFCRKAPAKVKACVKEYWQCSNCKKSSRKKVECSSETCKKFGSAVEKKVSRSRLIFACRGDCNTRKNEKFECKVKTCKSSGSNSIQICEFSGTFPHTPD